MSKTSHGQQLWYYWCSFFCKIILLVFSTLNAFISGVKK